MTLSRVSNPLLTMALTVCVNSVHGNAKTVRRRCNSLLFQRPRRGLDRLSGALNQRVEHGRVARLGSLEIEERQDRFQLLPHGTLIAQQPDLLRLLDTLVIIDDGYSFEIVETLGCNCLYKSKMVITF